MLFGREEQMQIKQPTSQGGRWSQPAVAASLQAMGEKTCPSAATLRATAPGDTAVIPLASAFQPCGGKIRVSPIRAEADPEMAT